jgi:hypothetical protein
MKLDVFKKLIKEAVKEAVREELEIILSESPVKQKAPVINNVTKYEKYTQPISKQTRSGDPIMDVLNETRASMTQESYRDFLGATSDMVQAPGIGMAPQEYSTSGHQPGLDLSTLSFVKNAGKVFKASIEKDKQRLGA